MPLPAQKILNLPIVEEADASPEVHGLYEQFRERFGRPQVPGILKCFATHPPLLDHMMGIAESMLFSEGSLGRRNRELLATFVSASNRCDYCADSHGNFLQLNGGSPALLDAALTCNLEAESLGEAQKALLQFAKKVTGESDHVDALDIERMRQAGWDDTQIAEAIHLAALFACFNRVVNAFGLPSQQMLSNTQTGSNGHE